MKEQHKKVLLIGGAGIVALILLSKKPTTDGFGAGAGGEGIEKKEPGEAEESDTVFITTTERAEAISGKKEVTASESSWESLFETLGQYGEQTPGYLATGGYTRPSGAFEVLGPTHPESPYYAIAGFPDPTPTGGRVLTKKGRGLRVGEFRERYNVPSDYSYPVTSTIKVTN